MTLTSIVTLRQEKKGGKDVLTVVVPRRIYLMLRTLMVDSIEFKFSDTESFQLDTDQLGRAIKETYDRRRKQRRG